MRSNRDHPLLAFDRALRASVPQPVLAVYGADDPALPRGAMEATRAHVSGPLTEQQFRYGWTHVQSAEESAMLYAQHHVAAPAKPLFQGAFANLNPRSETSSESGIVTGTVHPRFTMAMSCPR